MEDFKTIIEPFRIKMVEPIKLSTRVEREQFLSDACYNPFLLDSEKVIIDFLTDSGTSAMSSDQWAGIMQGDESYAGARSWKKMQGVIQRLTGHEYILPTHQGRAAERILYGYLGGKGKTFISNTHNVPPLTPVYSYHCTQSLETANTFPRLSQGHGASQFK